MKYVIGIILASISLAAAALRPNARESEVALLPPYCVDTEYFSGGPKYSNRMSPRAPYWVGVMGEGFWWLHHYCSGLVFAKRAETLRSNDRQYRLREAKMEYIYTIKQLPQDFILLPEMYTQLGEVEAQLGNTADAYSAFLRARELKPDYWPAYSKWVDVLIKSGLKTEARTLVKEGLGYAPDAKVLLDQYKLLGGDAAETQPVTNAPAAKRRP